jgi:DNA-binding PucR family transcriptional regulator
MRSDTTQSPGNDKMLGAADASRGKPSERQELAMALFDTGERTEWNDLLGTNARAVDDLDGTVVVAASHEAIADKGWSAIFEVASAKYEADDIVADSAPPCVQVTSEDFEVRN